MSQYEVQCYKYSGDRQAWEQEEWSWSELRPFSLAMRECMWQYQNYHFKVVHFYFSNGNKIVLCLNLLVWVSWICLMYIHLLMGLMGIGASVVGILQLLVESYLFVIKICLVDWNGLWISKKPRSEELTRIYLQCLLVFWFGFM